MIPNFYEILQISQSASLSEIKKSYRTLAKKLHPDVNKKQDAHVKFTELQQAYEILEDKYLREQYDKEYNKYYKIKNQETSKHSNSQQRNNYVQIGTNFFENNELNQKSNQAKSNAKKYAETPYDIFLKEILLVGSEISIIIKYVVKIFISIVLLLFVFLFMLSNTSNEGEVGFVRLFFIVGIVLIFNFIKYEKK